jgi:glycosyltransferase involved in cell wall biosynthesis
MKILHLMLSSFYIDGYSYQENILPRIHAEDGHQVAILASREIFQDHQALGFTKTGSYLNEDGIPVTRIPYRWFLPPRVGRKVRAYPGVRAFLDAFGPDVILFHGLQAYELLTVARYKRDHPEVRLYADSHADAHNSGTQFLSKWALHRGFYRQLIHGALPHLDKILYISTEAREFLCREYRLPDEKLEFFPLGGIIDIPSARAEKRAHRRSELGLSTQDILILHSGKLDASKRTEDLIRAFSAVPDPRLRLVLIGSLAPAIRERLEALLAQDPRISFLGWKPASELQEYLCACDLYAQPGSQSATMQAALCTFAPLMLYPHPSHDVYLRANGFYVRTVADMTEAFRAILADPLSLDSFRRASERIACEILDYRKLAARIYV